MRVPLRTRRCIAAADIPSARTSHRVMIPCPKLARRAALRSALSTGGRIPTSSGRSAAFRPPAGGHRAGRALLRVALDVVDQVLDLMRDVALVDVLAAA